LEREHESDANCAGILQQFQPQTQHFLSISLLTFNVQVQGPIIISKQA